MKLYLRQYQHKDASAGNINCTFTLSTTNEIVVNSGSSVPFPNWIDFTDWVGAENSQDYDLQGSLVVDYESADAGKYNFHAKKNISETILLFGEGYTFVKDWLISHPVAQLNRIEAKITYDDCGGEVNIGFFEILPEGITWTDNVCAIQNVLVEKSKIKNLLKSTYIFDNHQGWFQPLPTPGMIHPRIQYVQYSQELMSKVQPFALLMMIPTFALFARDYILKDVMGYGRCIPSPFIRTYIENFCMKIGIGWDTIFHYNKMPSPYDNDNLKYYNACYSHLAVKRGIDFEIDNSTDWIDENRPIKTAYTFLNELAELFNCEWTVADIDGAGNKLIFQPKAWMENNMPTVFNFQTTDADLLVDNIDYQWDEQKLSAGIEGVYVNDGKEICGNSATDRYNDEEVYTEKFLKDELDGIEQVNSKISNMAGYDDGISVMNDYFNDFITSANGVAGTILLAISAYIITINPLTAAAVIAAIGVSILSNNAIINSYYNNFFTDYNLMVSSFTWDNAKIIIPDLVNFNINNCKPLLTDSSTISSNPHTLPSYSNYWDKQSNYAQPSINLYNYEMEFDSSFVGNLYDHFWQREDSTYYYKKNGTCTITTKLCCSSLNRLNIEENKEAVLFYGVILPDGNRAKITGIKVDFGKSLIILNCKI